ncbi:MAG: hypothetical protein LBG83_02970 [Oscillospiraceae bacterium]|nr:hypothetical protein [Oscillospiraceae bacterium]
MASGFLGQRVAGAAPVYNVARQDAKMRNAQGNCTDGQYVYQCLVKEVGGAAEEVEIQKIRLRDWKRVLTVATQRNPAFEGYGLYHGADLCYNPQLGQIVAIAFSNYERPQHSLIYLDPETLLPVGKRKVSGVAQFFTIDYEPVSQRYVATRTGAGGVRNFVVFDSQFNKLAEFPIAPAKKTTATVCDETYIYCLENDPAYGSFARSQLHVFGWDGAYVKSVKIASPGEIEDLFIKNGYFYIAYNTLEIVNGRVKNGGRADPMTLRKVTPSISAMLSNPPAFFRSGRLAEWYMERMVSYTSRAEATFVKWFG